MEKVVLLKCTDYNVDAIEKKLREGFELLGGSPFLRALIPENRKPNFLSVIEKGSPVITHYAIFEAVVRIVKEYSNNIEFCDSPGSGDTRKAAEKSGLMEVAGRYGVRFVDFNEEVHSKNYFCSNFSIAWHMSPSMSLLNFSIICSGFSFAPVFNQANKSPTKA